MPSDKQLRKLRDKKWDEAGGGRWFRNSDNKEVYVAVQFYPATRLWLHDGPLPVAGQDPVPITTEARLPPFTSLRKSNGKTMLWRFTNRGWSVYGMRFVAVR